MYVVSAAQMRELDRLTIREYGTPGHVLMERAGMGAAQVLLDFFGNSPPDRAVVVAGKGNNGGDGLVIARVLKRRGIDCQVVLAARKRDVQGDAKRTLQAFTRLKGHIGEVTAEDDLPAVQRRLARAGVIVDALLGTGLNAPAGGLHAALIDRMNAADAPVVAVDVPSGLDADTGRTPGPVVQAAVTATFGYPKLGQLVYPGAASVGRLVCVDIGIPREALETVAPGTEVLTRPEVGRLVPARPPEAHKGDFGHLLVLAGARGKSGAALLSASAALRCGTGLVTLAGPRSLIPIFSTVLLEAMTAAQPERADGSLKLDERQLRRALDGKTALVFGPGVGVSAETKRIAEWLLTHSRVPLLIDADGLNCVASNPAVLKTARVPVVLTPHPGEMARLVRITTADVQARRMDVARSFAEQTGCYVVLKGARSLVADPDGRVCINPTGNPGMASGGMGDVLSGVIGGLLAQGYPPYDACRLGTFLHGAAADTWARTRGEAGLLARDVIDGLPETLRDLSEAGQNDSHAAEYCDVIG